MVAMIQGGFLHTFAIDENAVEAVEIVNAPFLAFEYQAAMAATDIGEGQPDLGLGMPADNNFRPMHLNSRADGFGLKDQRDKSARKLLVQVAVRPLQRMSFGQSSHIFHGSVLPGFLNITDGL